MLFVLTVYLSYKHTEVEFFILQCLNFVPIRSFSLINYIFDNFNDKRLIRRAIKSAYEMLRAIKITIGFACSNIVVSILQLYLPHFASFFRTLTQEKNGVQFSFKIDLLQHSSFINKVKGNKAYPGIGM